MQSRKRSWCESGIQVGGGYVLAIGLQLIMFPMFDCEVSLIDNLIIGLAFLVLSLVRQYLIRRAGEWYQCRS